MLTHASPDVVGRESAPTGDERARFVEGRCNIAPPSDEEEAKAVFVGAALADEGFVVSSNSISSIPP